MTNQSIAGQRLAPATEAVIIAPGAEHLWGYAGLSGTKDDPEIEVFTFDTRAELARALSEVRSAIKGKYHTVYRFGPDQPLNMYPVFEDHVEVTP